MRARLDTRLTMIVLIAIAFAAVEWGSRDVRFGVTILFVAFVAFLAGGRRWRRWVPAREKPVSYDDLVEAETRAFAAEERLIGQRAEAEKHVRALLYADKRSDGARVKDRDAALEWLHESQGVAATDQGALEVIVDFLTSWRFCPVSGATEPSRECIEDAARQLLDALEGAKV